MPCVFKRQKENANALIGEELFSQISYNVWGGVARPVPAQSCCLQTNWLLRAELHRQRKKDFAKESKASLNQNLSEGHIFFSSEPRSPTQFWAFLSKTVFLAYLIELFLLFHFFPQTAASSQLISGYFKRSSYSLFPLLTKSLYILTLGPMCLSLLSSEQLFVWMLLKQINKQTKAFFFM